MNTTHTKYWVLFIAVVYFVIGAYYLLDMFAVSHHERMINVVNMILSLVGALLSVLLGVSLILAQCLHRPSLYIFFLVLNAISIFFCAVMLVLIAFGFVLFINGHVAGEMDEKGGPSKMGDKGRHSSEDEMPAWQSVVGLVVAIVLLLLPIFFEYIVYKAWRIERIAVVTHVGNTARGTRVISTKA